MKKIYILIIIGLFPILCSSQNFGEVDLELGGASYLGISANYRYNFLNENQQGFIPRLGFGHSLPIWDDLFSLNFGLDYRIKRFEIGFDGCWYFLFFPIDKQYLYPTINGILTYPHIKYRIEKDAWTFKIGLGATIPFEKYGTEYYYGDGIPCASISLGYKFYKS